MRLKNITYFACAAALSLSLNSCGDFLDRPVEDNYNIDNFYASDAACVSGVNYLYTSAWYAFQRGFITMGEAMSGNMYWGFLLYPSDAADDLRSVDIGGRRTTKKKKKQTAICA